MRDNHAKKSKLLYFITPVYRNTVGKTLNA